MSEQVIWRNYTYDVCHDGARYIAIDRTKGRDKRRMNFKVWQNIHDGSTINPELATELEAAVSRIESTNAVRQYVPARGKHGGRISPNTERPVRKASRRESRKAGVE
jgi:hypothetical protein